MDFRVSFDSGFIEKKFITKNIYGDNAKQILDALLDGTDLLFEFKHDTYLIFYNKGQSDKMPTRSESNYSGIVIDKETGEKLPYATIYLWDKNVSISTSVEGTFSLRLKDSTYTPVQIKYLGYQTLDTIICTNDKIPLINIGLEKKSQNIPTVDVQGEKMEMVDFTEEAGHLSFNPSKFADLPNYGETDVFRALQLLPGISSFENSSQLNVRGGSADQNLVLLDGFTLYNLDHFFGVFSALNPNVIKNIQVYRGGFDSRYGERISAIVDIVGKSGNQTKPEFYGGLNMISGNLTAEIPISKKLTLVAAGRRAYSDMYSSWLADELLNDKLGQTRRLPTPDANVITPEFYFSDFNTKLNYTISPQENISFSAYGSKDNLNSSSFNTNDWGEMDINDTNKWGNYGLGASWNKQWNPKYFSTVLLGHSGYYNDYKNNTTLTFDTLNTTQPTVIEQDVLNEVTNETNDLTDYFITFRNEYSLNTDHLLEFGVSTKFNQFTYYKDATRDFIYSNLKSSAFLHTLFAQDKINLNNKLVVKPGLRLNYYSNSRKFYFEPRLVASYKTDAGLTLKMATGRYYQFLNKSSSEQTYGYNRDFWVLADGNENPVLKSNHFIAGFSFEKNNLYLDVEGYFKTVDGLQEYLFYDNPEDRQAPGQPEGNNPGLSQFISGTGKAMGIDFLLKYEGSNFTSWLAYSLSKSTKKFDEINNGAQIPTAYDQTHELKWTNIYNYRKWNFSTLTIYNTGKPYIESSTKDENFNTTRVYNRLPDYFRVDFSANYNFNFKKVNLKPGLSILNAFNTENYLDIYTRVFTRESQRINETTLVRAQSLTFNFFINFRF